MGKSRRRKKRTPRSAGAVGQAGDEVGRRLLRGERIDLGDFVMTSLGAEPSYGKATRRAKTAVATIVPASLGFDPFGKLRVADYEIDRLVEDVDDWLRVGNHVRVRTVVRRTLLVGDERVMRTDHETEFDPPPEEWALRAARIVADLRSQLDHLVFSLVNRAAPRPLTEEELERLSFPIDEPKRPQTLEKLRRKLPFLAEESLVEILRAQPTSLPDGIHHGRSHLWMLNKLNNLDKHRALNVMGTGRITFRGPNSRGLGEGELFVVAEDLLGQPCEDGCHVDAIVCFGERDVDRFEQPDGSVKPLVALCRFLREAFAEVVGITSILLETEDLLKEWDQ